MSDELDTWQRRANALQAQGYIVKEQRVSIGAGSFATEVWEIEILRPRKPFSLRAVTRGEAWDHIAQLFPCERSDQE